MLPCDLKVMGLNLGNSLSAYGGNAIYPSHTILGGGGGGAPIFIFFYIRGCSIPSHSEEPLDNGVRSVRGHVQLLEWS